MCMSDDNARHGPRTIDAFQIYFPAIDVIILILCMCHIANFVFEFNYR